MVKVKASFSWVLLFVPIAFVMRFWPVAENPTVLFICSAIGIIPLAGLMGRATEALAARMGEGAGGVLNTTFGKAAELIISVISLLKSMSSRVQTSNDRSIICNILSFDR